jgi:hypothetical protein
MGSYELLAIRPPEIKNQLFLINDCIIEKIIS